MTLDPARSLLEISFGLDARISSGVKFQLQLLKLDRGAGWRLLVPRILRAVIGCVSTEFRGQSELSCKVTHCTSVRLTRVLSIAHFEGYDVKAPAV